MAFRLLHTDPKSHARAGELDTGHGTVPTPLFMPVGTQGAVKTATAEQLHVTGAVHRLGGLADALVWADELAHLAPLTIRAHKLGLEADERFEAARVAAWASADAEEGRLAFLEKRPPVFRAE